MKKVSMAVSIVAAILMLVFMPVLSADTSDDSVLFDLGNGQTYWYEPDHGKNMEGTITSAAEYFGLEVICENGKLVSFGGVYECEIGNDQAEEKNRSSWTLYKWDGTMWVRQDKYDLSSVPEGHIAWAFGDVVPVATPLSKYVWTTFKGSSEAKSVSNSYGPDDPQVPVEWSKTYTTGYVDSGILAVGDLLYHTTAGDYYGTGTDKDPWVYCLDRFTGEEIWNFHYAKGAGYEVSTPVIIGDMILIPASSGHIHCLDRFTGDLLWTLDIPYDPPSSDSITPDWNGRTFVAGPTTLIYDSGALFFGSSDGKIYCYSVDRNGYKELWMTAPSLEEGVGCFYYNAPVMTTLDSGRVLFIGNYDGYLFALRISDGTKYWDTLGKQLIDLSGTDGETGKQMNTAVPGTPGSVAAIVPTSDGKLLVTCTDGAMTCLTGFVTAIDARNGYEIWRIDALMSSPVALKDGFITYVSPAAKGASELAFEDGTYKEVGYAVYKFNYDGEVIWQSEEYQWIKPPLTYADGIIYAMDYSAGYYYPSGGCLTAFNADTGEEIWRLLLEPFSATSYSMVQPTIIDGRIYVGNDYGAVYCLSNIASELPPIEDVSVLDTPGFKHWSWYVLGVSIIAMMIVMVRLY